MKHNLHTQIDARVKQAFDAAAPDLLDAVLCGCESEKGTVITMTNQRKHFNFKKSMIACAACLAMVIGCFAAYGALAPTDKIGTEPKSPISSNGGNAATAATVATVVTLDVNPSIEIKADAAEKVLAVLALNEDAKAVIGDNKFDGSTLQATVGTLIDSMIEQGYLNESTNSVLLSVENENETTGNGIKDKLANEITDKIEGDVIGQVVSSKDSQLSELATTYGITLGKAKFICQIIGNEDKNFADYIHYSITELNTLLKASVEENEGGEGEEKNYIGKEAALQIVLEALDLTLEDLDEYPTIVLDVRRGEVFYDIFIKISHYEDEYNWSHEEFHCYVHAITGKQVGEGVTKPNITMDEAWSCVCEQLGEDAKDVKLLDKVFHDMESGLPMTYSFHFEIGGTEYTALVDAMDGTVIRIVEW